MLLTESNMFFHNYLQFNLYEYWHKNFYGKNLTFNQLNDQQKQMLNKMIDILLDALQQNINQITKQINQKSWVLKNFINNTYIPDEDNQKYQEALTLFNHYKKRKQMVKKDIKQYKSYSELYDAVSKFLTMQNVYDYANSQCKRICSAGHYSCYRVDNFQQGKILFNKTGWCVKGHDYFDQYGAPYYIVFSGQERIALIHLDSEQCKDVSDNPIYGDGVNSQFFKMLGALFESQNNGQFLIGNDFEGYASYYIDNCIDQVDQFLDIVSDAIYESDFQHIQYILEALNRKNKLSVIDQNEDVKQKLKDKLDEGETENRDFQNLVQFCVENEIKLSYPITANYIIAWSDSVEMWKKLWKNNQKQDIDYDYQQLVLSTYHILKYELENGYQLSRFDVEQAKYVLQDYTKQIDSVQGAKKFLSMFYYETSEQLQQLIEYIFDYLDLTEQQKEYLEQFKQQYKKKEAFDNYPTLPGLEEYV